LPAIIQLDLDPLSGRQGDQFDPSLGLRTCQAIIAPAATIHEFLKHRSYAQPPF